MITRNHRPRRRGQAFHVGRSVLCIEAWKGVHPVDDMAGAVLRRLPVRAGDFVADIGCGTGLYGLAALLLGAEAALLTDVDPRALRCARASAKRNHLEAARFAAGDLFDPCRGLRFDLVIANLPQTPGSVPFLVSKWGGVDGTIHLRRLIRAAPRHLRPGGRLCFVLHDLCDSRRVERLLGRRFRTRSVYTMRRNFDPDEYEHYHPGLFAHLERLRQRGKARFHGKGKRRWFRLRFLVATLRAD